MEHHIENCKEVFALLSQYLDSELNPESCEEIREHLAGCPPCIEFLESLRRTINICHHCDPAPAPEPIGTEVKDKLMAAYRAAMERRKAG